VGFDAAEAAVVAEKCESLVSSYIPLMEQAELRRVSFVFNHGKDEYFDEYSPPAMFTYRYPNFEEDSLYRDIEPSHAYHLELTRVAANFRVRSLGSRHTTTCHVHMYEATPRVTALAKDKIASKNPRIFVRALSSVIDFSSAGFERILVDALNSLDLVALRSKADNHLFINLVSDFEKAILDPVVVEEVVVSILKRHGARMTKLGLVEVETRVVCCLSRDSPPIALRLVASNPTGYVHVMSTYVEAFDETNSQRVFKLIGGTKASLAGSGDNSWEGMKVRHPYPLTRPFDAQRKSAMKASDTLYCYDLPALFEAAVEQQWLDAAEEGGIEGGIRASARPLMVMYTSELVVHRKNRSTVSSDWTMKDYLAGDLELVQMNRGAGANDVGMVAWLMVLKTVEYPQVRNLMVMNGGLNV
jgi:acetyl-CoA carboxylase/biotin carboxylase 1